MFEKDINEYPLQDSVKKNGNRAKDKPKYDPISTTEGELEPNTANAKVITKTKNGVTGIDFKGFGVLIPTPNKEYVVGDTIEVSYTSDIGKPDFKINIEVV